MDADSRAARSRWVAALLWLWVGAAFLAWLYQFRPLLGPIAAAIGLDGRAGGG